ncbi:thialysine N-epsilon-acetyltransferase [Sabethes cyaneus]|uniref:thialysine N-epsilon-acetyltransferase n=1 Tax=Sabethes cyaneus TaxID=53552 RepID=UPI00237EDB12|nr:thialysine N-epsilon-acetyltransferase [Sabethes cyaneus]XP_053693219.1 thialysine N-epsilon-acetyltransferase [Sabethes cyaneus]
MAFCDNATVRKAVKEDLGAIIEMIQELADFEGMSDGPTLTVQDLVRDGGFDDDGASAPAVPIFHSFVLELTEQVQTGDNEEKITSFSSNGELLTCTRLIGYAICFYSYSTWQGKSFFLEDIYVKPNYRKRGYGELLFKTLIRHARENDCARFDFHVLAWNPAKQFYNRMGAENLTESERWEFYRLSREKMDALIKSQS